MTQKLTAPAPFTLTLRDGQALTVRALATGDGDALATFFAALPEAERHLMKEDVADHATARAWAAGAERGGALALLALDGQRIVADAALVGHRGGFRSHQVDVRISILPEYRGKGLGTALVRKLAEIAWDADFEFVDFELVAGPQDAAIEAMQSLGAYPAGVLEEYVRDFEGAARDLVFLRLPLGQWFTF